MNRSNKEYEVQNVMVHGLGANSKTAQVEVRHPLEASEKSFMLRKEQLDMAMLRKTQGLHAPLRLQMEKRSLAKVGHLPFLPRSNASLHALTGQDELIGFDDFLGHANEPEMMGQPHAMVEKNLGIL